MRECVKSQKIVRECVNHNHYGGGGLARTWFREDGDPDVCGHAALPLSYDPNTPCGQCRGKCKIGEVWLECPLCDQCFFRKCFLK